MCLAELNIAHVQRTVTCCVFARIQWKLLWQKHDVGIVLSRNLTSSRSVDCYIWCLCLHSMETVIAETRRQHGVWQKHDIAHVQWTVARCVSARIQWKLLWHKHNIVNTTLMLLEVWNESNPNFHKQLPI